MSRKPMLAVMASGTKTGGGSGFENLVKASRDGRLDAAIFVISNHENGGVRERANKLGVPFTYFPGPWTAENYRKITEGADFVALSGWLKMVYGLDPKTTFNIHPGPLPKFGGDGMYSHHVHEAVVSAYRRGEIAESAVTMHFVIEGYDKGPIFFAEKVEMRPDDTPESLQVRVNMAEHKFQPLVTQAVLRGEVSWDGKDPSTLVSPYHF